MTPEELLTELERDELRIAYEIGISEWVEHASQATTLQAPFPQIPTLGDVPLLPLAVRGQEGHEEQAHQ